MWATPGANVILCPSHALLLRSENKCVPRWASSREYVAIVSLPERTTACTSHGLVRCFTCPRARTRHPTGTRKLEKPGRGMHVPMAPSLCSGIPWSSDHSRVLAPRRDDLRASRRSCGTNQHDSLYQPVRSPSRRDRDSGSQARRHTDGHVRGPAGRAAEAGEKIDPWLICMIALAHFPGEGRVTAGVAHESGGALGQTPEGLDVFPEPARPRPTSTDSSRLAIFLRPLRALCGQFL